MNHSLVLVILALSVAVPSYEAAAQSSTQLQISGTVYGPTCTLSSDSINVALPDVGTYQFSAVGAHVELGHTVDIVLLNCSTAVATTLKLAFSGTLAGSDPTDLALTSGLVDAVALKLRIPGNLGLAQAFVPFDGDVLDIPLQDGTMSLSFPVEYKALQLPVPAGSVNAHASFTITYS